MIRIAKCQAVIFFKDKMCIKNTDGHIYNFKFNKTVKSEWNLQKDLMNLHTLFAARLSSAWCNSKALFCHTRGLEWKTKYYKHIKNI